MPELVTDSQLVDLARAGLLEITPEDTVGALISESTDDEGVSTVLFASAMLGYPDWRWTVSLATLPGEAPTVLEAELMPGEGAILAPDWVPWADRLEDYKAAQAAIAAGELAAGDESDDDPDDESDDDESDDEGDLDDDDSDDDDSDDDGQHDDFGDDPDDGIDFESDEALAAVSLAAVPTTVGVDEQDEAEAESDEDGPEPPAAPVRKQRTKKEQ
jgi:hypothetical protein